MLPGVWFQTRRGTREEARDYCRKRDETRVPDTLEEFGSFDEGGQGARTDILAVAEALRSGTSVHTLVLNFPILAARYPRFFSTYSSAVGRESPRRWLTKVIVLQGPPGIGKTRLVYDLFPTCWAFTPNPSGPIWFDGYQGHRGVLFDDFTGREIPLTTLLRILDRHPYSAPIKGGFAEFAPYVICITTNLEPREWYPFAADTPLRS